MGKGTIIKAVKENRFMYLQTGDRKCFEQQCFEQLSQHQNPTNPYKENLSGWPGVGQQTITESPDNFFYRGFLIGGLRLLFLMLYAVLMKVSIQEKRHT